MPGLDAWSSYLGKERITGRSGKERGTPSTTKLAVSLLFFPLWCLLAWTPSRQNPGPAYHEGRRSSQRSCLFLVLGWGKRAYVSQRESGRSLFIAASHLPLQPLGNPTAAEAVTARQVPKTSGRGTLLSDQRKCGPNSKRVMPIAFSCSLGFLI